MFTKTLFRERCSKGKIQIFLTMFKQKLQKALKKLNKILKRKKEFKDHNEVRTDIALIKFANNRFNHRGSIKIFR